MDSIRIILMCSSADHDGHAAEEKGLRCSSNLSAAIAACSFVRWVLDASSCLCSDETQPDSVTSVDHRPTFLCATVNHGVLRNCPFVAVMVNIIYF